MKILADLIVSIINLPLYYISIYIKRDPNLWVFGAWFGDKYADNSKHLFEYVAENNKEIKVIWLSKNKKIVKKLRSNNYCSYGTYSLKGYYYTLRAKFIFISTSILDVNYYVAGNSKIIQLWHGTPLKKIMYDDKKTFNGDTLLRNIYYILFPFKKKARDYSDAFFMVPSETVKKTFLSAFKCPDSNVYITGYSRNDALFNPNKIIECSIYDKLKQYFNEYKIGLYLPTHRNEGGKLFIETLLDEFILLNEYLKKNKIILLVKLHYYHQKEINDSNIKFSNIVFIKDSEINDDIYNILPIADFLLTDYSSVYFDYLLLKRPIFFIPFDYDSYTKIDREFYYDYLSVVPGPVCYTWDDLIVELNYYIKNSKDDYQLKREDISKQFNFYSNSFSERIYNTVKLLK